MNTTSAHDDIVKDPTIPAPIAYLVTERRQGDVLLGDDWTRHCGSLDEARGVAARWRELGTPFDVVVLAITEVPS